MKGQLWFVEAAQESLYHSVRNMSYVKPKSISHAFFHSFSCAKHEYFTANKSDMVHPVRSTRRSSTSNLAGCCGLNVCVCPKVICWNPNSQKDVISLLKFFFIVYLNCTKRFPCDIFIKRVVFGGWIFGRGLGHENRGLMIGISVIIKDLLVRALTLLLCKVRVRRHHIWIRSGPSPHFMSTSLPETWSWTSSLQNHKK
jgi:hypothetical protein